MSYKLPFFLLIGQSNMSGRGEITHLPCRSVNDRVQIFTGDDWKIASDPLQNPNDPIFAVKADKVGGVGPGVAFANEMHAIYDRVGLLLCARGGCGIRAWGEDAREGLLRETLRRANKAIEAGGSLAGILIYVGEGDTSSNEEAEAWAPRFRRLVQRLRTLNNVPVVFAQIGSISEERRKTRVHGYVAWETLQRVQETVAEPRTSMVVTADLALNPDGLHLSTAAQLELGRRFATAMYTQLGVASTDERHEENH